MSRKCPYCDSALGVSQDVCPNCGGVYEEKKQAVPAKRPLKPQAPANSLGVRTQSMGWNNFLVKLGLYLYAALLAFRGAAYALGKAYDALELAVDVYAVAPMLKPADLLYGSMLFAGALFALKIRGRMQDFRRNAPMLLHLLLGGVMACSVGYLMGSTSAVTGTALAGSYPVASGMIWEIVLTGIVLVCDVVYYRNRKDLFTL